MKFIKREEGQGLVEYALLLVLVAVVVIGILILLGGQVEGTFRRIVNTFSGLGNYDITITKFIVNTGGTIGNCTVTVVAAADVIGAQDGVNIPASVSGGFSMNLNASVNNGKVNWTQTTNLPSCPSSAKLAVGSATATWP